MRVLVAVLLIFVTLHAFEVEMIDETEEGKRKAKENTVAKDGKVTYRPAEKHILEPMKAKVLKPIERHMAKVHAQKMIYPIDVEAPVSIKDKTAEQKETEKNSFVSRDELESASKVKAAEIEVDKFFDGIKETNKSKQIEPVNIE